MRCRLLLRIVAGLSLFAVVAYAAAQIFPPQETAAIDVVTRWKIANTVLFALGLAYLIAKYAPPFFNARSADIQKAIQDAMGLKIEAEFRYSEIDKKMASLAAEIKKLREQYSVEREREHERFQHETELQIGHIHHNVVAEVEALRLEGAQKIRKHTAQLALEMAERRLRDRIASIQHDDLVQDFIHLVERGRNQ